MDHVEASKPSTPVMEVFVVQLILKLCMTITSATIPKLHLKHDKRWEPGVHLPVAAFLMAMKYAECSRQCAWLEAAGQQLRDHIMLWAHQPVDEVVQNFSSIVRDTPGVRVWATTLLERQQQTLAGEGYQTCPIHSSLTRAEVKTRVATVIGAQRIHLACTNTGKGVISN